MERPDQIFLPQQDTILVCSQKAYSFKNLIPLKKNTNPFAVVLLGREEGRRGKGDDGVK